MLHPKEWVSNYGDYLFSIAFMKTNNKETAEDLVQDTFFSAVKAVSSFKEESTEKTWLVKILQNKIVDHYRKKDVLKDTTAYLEQTSDNFDEQFFHADASSEAHWKTAAMPEHWKSAADDSIRQAEFNAVVAHCLQKLPPRLLPVFVSKFIEDEGPEKICKDYDISSSNYWVMIHRAKLIMRSCLEKNWFSNASKK